MCLLYFFEIIWAAQITHMSDDRMREARDEDEGEEEEEGVLERRKKERKTEWRGIEEEEEEGELSGRMD